MGFLKGKDAEVQKEMLVNIDGIDRADYETIEGSKLHRLTLSLRGGQRVTFTAQSAAEAWAILEKHLEK